jgi:hypothetical protein
MLLDKTPLVVLGTQHQQRLRLCSHATKVEARLDRTSASAYLCSYTMWRAKGEVDLYLLGRQSLRSHRR